MRFHSLYCLVWSVCIPILILPNFVCINSNLNTHKAFNLFFFFCFRFGFGFGFSFNEQNALAFSQTVNHTLNIYDFIYFNSVFNWKLVRLDEEIFVHTHVLPPKLCVDALLIAATAACAFHNPCGYLCVHICFFFVIYRCTLWHQLVSCLVLNWRHSGGRRQNISFSWWSKIDDLIFMLYLLLYLPSAYRIKLNVFQILSCHPGWLSYLSYAKHVTRGNNENLAFQIE